METIVRRILITRKQSLTFCQFGYGYVCSRHENEYLSNHSLLFSSANISFQRSLSTTTNSSEADFSTGFKNAKPVTRVSDILAIKSQTEFTVPQSANVSDAVTFLVNNKTASALVVDSAGSLVGIFTARDVLRFINEQGILGRSGKSANFFQMPITDVMSRREKLVYCSPSDSVKRCLEMMFQLKIRNMPVIERNEVLGIVTMKDLADSSFSLMDIGGKKGFIHNVTGRKGIPEGTRLTKTVEDKMQLKKKPPIHVNIGSFELPHPYKSVDGVCSTRRDYGASNLCDDVSLCEDAHFTMQLKDPISAIADSQKVESSQVFFSVADGVGSWRQFGVDPREFSHRLVKNAENVLLADAEQRFIMKESGLGLMDQETLHPMDVMLDAWNLTIGERVIGSSTFCVASIDKNTSQLSYANVGDCGLMVIRHIDSETAGYMRERSTPRHLRKNDLRIAYLSQQQLRSFNFPYQLGFSSISEGETTFETPKDADHAMVSLLPGDVIILASDGLFDNLDLNEVVDEVCQWEDKWFPSVDGSEIQKYSESGDSAVQALAEQLVHKSREYSLDKMRDSPFAVLAKENDIMWGGGMPDDTTVVVARVAYNRIS